MSLSLRTTTALRTHLLSTALRTFSTNPLLTHPPLSQITPTPHIAKLFPQTSFPYSSLQSTHPTDSSIQIIDLTLPFPPITRTGRRKDSVASVTISPAIRKSALKPDSLSHAIFASTPDNGFLPTKFTINGLTFPTYITRDSHRLKILDPLERTKTLSAFNIHVKVSGGGASGQTGAITMGIARCLETLGGAKKLDEDGRNAKALFTYGKGGEFIIPNDDGFRLKMDGMFKALLKVTDTDPNHLLRGNETGSGLLKRDPRVVERKKPGRKKARKAFQWVKR